MRRQWRTPLVVVVAVALLNAGCTNVPSLGPSVDQSSTVSVTVEPTPTEPLPTKGTVGTPSDWIPQRRVTGEFRIETAGAVIEDLEVVDGNILVLAPNVTLRRVLVTGGTIFNQGNRGCNSGLAVEDTTIQPMPGQVFDKTWVLPAIGPGGYTARRVAIDGLPEGFRVSGASAGCGPVVIEDSFARVRPPEPCDDWHGDTLQGYDAPALTIRNSVLIIDDTSTCGGTAAFFYPANHGNQPFDVDQLVVQGGGYPMRTGVPGRVRGLMIVEDSWAYGPIDVNCSAILEWTATIVKLEPGGQPRVVRQLPCAT